MVNAQALPILQSYMVYKFVMSAHPTEIVLGFDSGLMALSKLMEERNKKITLDSDFGKQNTQLLKKIKL